MNVFTLLAEMFVHAENLHPSNTRSTRDIVALTYCPVLPSASRDALKSSTCFTQRLADLRSLWIQQAYARELVPKPHRSAFKPGYETSTERATLTSYEALDSPTQ